MIRRRSSRESPMDTTLSTTAVAAAAMTGRARMAASRQAFLLDQVPYGALINGYLVPLLVAVIVVCNLLVCLVLVRPNMRTATNAVLVAIAFSDSLHARPRRIRRERRPRNDPFRVERRTRNLCRRSTSPDATQLDRVSCGVDRL